MPLYLIDANILITAKNNLFPMDIMPKFWEIFAEKIDDGTIVILDKVQNEIINPGLPADDIEIWLKNRNATVLKSSTDDIKMVYASLFGLLESLPCYSQKAIIAWSDPRVADPWLIAAAKVHGLTIVTLEKRTQENGNNQNPKIPNIAEKMGVRYIDLITMLRELKIGWK